MAAARVAAAEGDDARTERRRPDALARGNATAMGAPRLVAVLSMLALFFAAGAGANANADASEEEIRSWGCNLNISPLVFHHVGKAGGGSVRARFSAAALNYSTNMRWRDQPWSYYPTEDADGVMHHGRFCLSEYPHFWPQEGRIFEGVSVCKATTPLGQMLGCPMQNRKCECGADGDRCDKVYTGFNPLGTELHWVSPEYLLKQWYPAQPHADARIAELIEAHAAKDAFTLSKKQKRNMADVACPEKAGVPHDMHMSEDFYDRCFDADVARIDQIAEEWWPDPKDWSAFMASLPVARVTVMREPGGWLLSQFFWHMFYRVGADCDDISLATVGAGRTDWRVHELMTSTKGDPAGWLTRIAMKQILYICGEHRLAQMHRGLPLDLADLEREAAGNLRQSFAVIGILDDFDDFYGMVDQRLAYMDTTLNPGVTGMRHAGGFSDDKEWCKARFKDPAFQQELMVASPEYGMLVRLYEVAVKVNAFQKEELASCAAP